MTRVAIPTLLYIVLAGLTAYNLASHGRTYALLALIPALFGLWGIVASGALLRLAHVGTGASDPLWVVDGARERVWAGLSPYGVGYPDHSLAANPFPYGPLMLIDSYPLEFFASVGILVLLAWKGKPWTLALAAGLPFFIYLTTSGNNDMLPTLFLAAGLLTLPHWSGGVLLGLSVTLKPYTAVFLPVAFSSGSGMVLMLALATTTLGYLPALWWGGFGESLAMVNAAHGSSVLRYLAVPLGIGALRWPLLACGAFAALMLTSEIWSFGYLIPLIVGMGILLESAYQPIRQRRRHGQIAGSPGGSRLVGVEAHVLVGGRHK